MIRVPGEGVAAQGHDARAHLPGAHVALREGPRQRPQPAEWADLARRAQAPVVRKDAEAEERDAARDGHHVALAGMGA